jgi:hypothetical protein
MFIVTYYYPLLVTAEYVLTGFAANFSNIRTYQRDVYHHISLTYYYPLLVTTEYVLTGFTALTFGRTNTTYCPSQSRQSMFLLAQTT